MKCVKKGLSDWREGGGHSFALMKEKFTSACRALPNFDKGLEAESDGLVGIVMVLSQEGMIVEIMVKN